jgi:hypothetical protein
MGYFDQQQRDIRASLEIFLYFNLPSAVLIKFVFVPFSHYIQTGLVCG